MPVTPGCSFTEPTFAIHPAEMLGEPLRWTSRIFIPLSRINSWTGICCAHRHGTQSMRRAALYITFPGYMVKGKSKVKGQKSKVFRFAESAHNLLVLRQPSLRQTHF